MSPPFPRKREKFLPRALCHHQMWLCLCLSPPHVDDFFVTTISASKKSPPKPKKSGMSPSKPNVAPKPICPEKVHMPEIYLFFYLPTWYPVYQTDFLLAPCSNGQKSCSETGQRASLKRALTAIKNIKTGSPFEPSMCANRSNGKLRIVAAHALFPSQLFRFQFSSRCHIAERNENAKARNSKSTLNKRPLLRLRG